MQNNFCLFNKKTFRRGIRTEFFRKIAMRFFATPVPFLPTPFFPVLFFSKLPFVFNPVLAVPIFITVFLPVIPGFETLLLRPFNPDFFTPKGAKPEAGI